MSYSDLAQKTLKLKISEFFNRSFLRQISVDGATPRLIENIVCGARQCVNSQKHPNDLDWEESTLEDLLRIAIKYRPFGWGIDGVGRGSVDLYFSILDKLDIDSSVRSDLQIDEAAQDVLDLLKTKSAS